MTHEEWKTFWLNMTICGIDPGNDTPPEPACWVCQNAKRTIGHRTGVHKIELTYPQWEGSGLKSTGVSVPLSGSWNASLHRHTRQLKARYT